MRRRSVTPTSADNNRRTLGDQAAGDRQHCRRGRRGQHGDPVRTGDPARATDVAAPTRSLRLSTSPSMRTASAISAAETTAGFREASSTCEATPAL